MRALQTILILLTLTSFSLAHELQSLSCTVQSGPISGSGVFIKRMVDGKSRTFVWTAAHNVAEKDNRLLPTLIITSQLTGGEIKVRSVYVTTMVRYSKTADLALFLLKDDHDPIQNGAHFNTDVPRVGSWVLHVGSPSGESGTMSRGIISQVGRGGLDQTDTSVNHGSSGGGIFNLDGELLGIVISMRTPTLNYFCPSREIDAWAKQVGVPWAVDENLPVPTLDEILEGPIVRK